MRLRSSGGAAAAMASAVRVLRFVTRSPAGAASMWMTGRSPSATTPRRIMPSPVAASSSSPTSSAATGRRSTTWIVIPCGKSVEIRRSATDEYCPVAAFSASGRTCSVDWPRAAISSASFTRAASLEVAPVTVTSRTRTNDESRNHT